MKGWEHDKNYFFYNFAFSSAHSQQNIINNTWLNETAKHILGIAVGANLGFKPSTDNQALPLDIIQSAYKNIYQIKQMPIILEPSKFDINCSEQLPVYYSLQRPIICSLEKQKTTEPRALVNIHYLNRMLSKYMEAFSSKKNNDCVYSGTSLQKVTEQIKVSYYHHAPKSTDNPIKTSSLIETEDVRFSHDAKTFGYHFPSEARFFRGCIKVSKN